MVQQTRICFLAREKWLTRKSFSSIFVYNWCAPKRNQIYDWFKTNLPWFFLYCLTFSFIVAGFSQEPGDWKREVNTITYTQLKIYFSSKHIFKKNKIKCRQNSWDKIPVAILKTIRFVNSVCTIFSLRKQGTHSSPNLSKLARADISC